MIVPIRCFSCNKVIGNKYEKWVMLNKVGMKKEDIFKELGLERYCCKTNLSTTVDLFDETNVYKNHKFPKHITSLPKKYPRVYIAR